MVFWIVFASYVASHARTFAYSFCSLRILKISDSFSPTTALPLFQSTVCSDVSKPSNLHWAFGASLFVTYHRANEALLVLAELLERVLVILGPLDELASASLAQVLHDGLDLVGGRSVLGDVELEWRTDTRSVVTRGGCLRLDRQLLDKVGNLDRGRRASLVEDGNDVEGFTLG